MGKSIKVHLPQPCDQQWSAMKTVPGGKHCAQCAKNIRDFRQASDRELWMLYQKEGQLCGLFRPDQLERPLHGPQKPQSMRGVAAALALGVMGSPVASSAQESASEVLDSEVDLSNLLLGEVVVNSMEPLPSSPEEPVLQEEVVKGRFFDADTKEPLPFVVVQLFENETAIVSCLTDVDGYFHVPYSELEGHLIDRINGTFIGYQTAVKQFDPPLPAHQLQDAIDDLGLTLSMDTVELLGVVHVERRAPWWKRLWWKLRY